MSYDLVGVLYEKFKTIQRSPTFKVRDFIVERSEDINGKVIVNYIKFQATQERTNLLDLFNKGDQIKVSFNLRGSKWEKEGQTSYFNNLDAWKIESVGSAPASHSGTGTTTENPSGLNGGTDDSDESDLPF